MTVRKVLIGVMIAGAMILAACKGNEDLKEEVRPVADAMCKFIDVENQMKTAAKASDSAAIDSLGKIRHEVQIEMTVLNQEFNKKFGDKFRDEKWIKNYKKAMNEALLECPHLSVQDREMMEKGMEMEK
jgi:hypothetical protein